MKNEPDEILDAAIDAKARAACLGMAPSSALVYNTTTKYCCAVDLTCMLYCPAWGIGLERIHTLATEVSSPDCLALRRMLMR